MLFRYSVRMLAGASVLSAMTLCTQPSFAQDRPPKAKIEATMHVTRRDGGSMARVVADNEIAIGESHTSFLYSNANGTAGALGEDRPLAWTAHYRCQWEVRVRVLSTDVDSVTFDLDWQRSEASDGTPRAVAGDHRRITLRQDERHVLDFVPSASADSPMANMLVEVTVIPVEDPTIAEQRLAYDLWLVHEAADGMKVTRRTTLSARQGERIPFSFPAVPLPLEADAPAGSDSQYRMHVEGTVAGRLTPDGTVRLALVASRQDRFPGGGGGTAWGFKRLTAAQSEVIGFELQTSHGYSGWRPGPGALPVKPRPGVTISEDGAVRVDHRTFFAGTKTSIIVTVRRDD